MSLPVGGEDRDQYRGSARLVRSSGTEPCDITRDGTAAVEHPDPGDVIWRDEVGVTCRRWNWRQGVRTRITETTTRAVFILDGLSELGPGGLAAAAGALETALHALSPGVTTERRTIAGPAY